MIAQFVEDFVHLESGRNRFDQDRRANRSARNADLALCEIEHIVPNPRLQVAFHFGEIKIWTRAALNQLARVMKEIQTEIEQRARNRFSVDQHVLFIQMPAARPDEQHSRSLIQFVIFSFRTTERNRPSNGVA